MTHDIERQDWNGCYAGGWQAAPLVPEAYSHPAKVSFTLADRIYRHMLAEGWLEPGSIVVDPFGGVAGFAFHAMLYGMHWRGVELEQKFVTLGNQNLDLWRDRYAPHFPNYGTATLVQGDSRRLVDVVTGAGGIVSSPPYANAVNGTGEVNSIDWSKGARAGMSNEGMKKRLAEQTTYGQTPGQLGAMPAGAVITSPPYAESEVASRAPSGADVDARKEKRANDDWSGYGQTAGNLGNLPAGVVTSPPFEQSIGNDKRVGNAATYTGHRVDAYAPSDGNIGNNTGDTFWSAAAQIVAQCYAILRPGGYAAFVTGDFVRNKKRVPFGEQWLALCESVGFEPVLWAVAHKAEDLGTQTAMFGDDVALSKTKVSFFRRLANANNPDAAITNEDVLFVRKPL